MPAPVKVEEHVQARFWVERGVLTPGSLPLHGKKLWRITKALAVPRALYEIHRARLRWGGALPLAGEPSVNVRPEFLNALRKGVQPNLGAPHARGIGQITLVSGMIAVGRNARGNGAAEDLRSIELRASRI
jgi:hypothetical protein